MGVIILDGLRPNVLFEFGYLKGKLKPTIILQSRGAQINIKTLYSRESDLNLTHRQFEKLLNPILDISRQFSDFAGKHVSYMDWRKHIDDEEHPRKVISRELLKSREKVLEETQKVYSSGIPPELISELTDEILFISECYFNPSEYDLDELLGAYREIKESARIHRFDINIRVQNMVASTLAIKGENVLPDVDTSVRCWCESIGVYNEIIEAQVLDIESESIGEVFFNIGKLYWSISDVRDTEDNLGKAIDAYNEALKIYTLEGFPVDYATTQNNLGNAYRLLGEVRDKEENVGKAIDAYNEALKTYTKEKYPTRYEAIKNIIKKIK